MNQFSQGPFLVAEQMQIAKEKSMSTTITIPDAPTLPLGAQPSPGYKSSELFTILAAAGGISSGQIPANLAPYVAALVGIYSICRTVLKIAHAWGYAKTVPDLPENPAPLPQEGKQP